MSMKYNCSKDRVLAFYFGECSSEEGNRIQRHLEECGDCSSYLNELRQTGNILRLWEDSSPDVNTWDEIRESISEKELEKTNTVSYYREIAPATPFIKILLIIMAMAFLLFMLRSRIPLFSFWNQWNDLWVVRLLGPLGMAIAAIFCLGAFITLSMTPILIWESRIFKK